MPGCNRSIPPRWRDERPPPTWRSDSTPAMTLQHRGVPDRARTPPVVRVRRPRHHPRWRSDMAARPVDHGVPTHGPAALRLLRLAPRHDVLVRMDCARCGAWPAWTAGRGGPRWPPGPPPEAPLPRRGAGHRWARPSSPTDSRGSRLGHVTPGGWGAGAAHRSLRDGRQARTVPPSGHRQAPEAAIGGAEDQRANSGSRYRAAPLKAPCKKTDAQYPRRQYVRPMSSPAAA